jgi:hypothetical protein
MFNFGDGQVRLPARRHHQHRAQLRLGDEQRLREAQVP